MKRQVVLGLTLVLVGCADCVPGRVRTLELSMAQRARFPAADGAISGVVCREVCAEFEHFTFDADLPRDAFEIDAVSDAGDVGVRQANVFACEVTGLQLVCHYESSCRGPL